MSRRERRAPGERHYRLLLRAHPRAFRDRYEAELVQCYREAWGADAEGRGLAAAAAFLFRMFAGVMGTAARQRVGAAMASFDTREGEGWGMGDIGFDLRLALRRLLRRPLWTAMVLLTLGPGMGATVAVFSVYQRVVLSPLPYDGSERLLRVQQRNVENGMEGLALSTPATAELRAATEVFDAVGVIQRGGVRGMTGSRGGRRPSR